MTEQNQEIEANYDDYDIVKFSEHPLQILMFKYTGKICIVGILCCFVATIFLKKTICLEILVVFAIVLAVGYLNIKLFTYFSYKIFFNKNKRTASFFLIDNDNAITIPYENFLKIEYNVYVFIRTTSKTILCASTHDKTLALALNDILPIKWGCLCSIWGPPKKFRDTVSQSK